MFLKISFSILILLYCIGGYSQELPDSLKAKLSGKSASEQVTYLNKVANQQLKSAPSVAYSLSKTAYQIATANGDKNGELNSALIAGKAARLTGKISDAVDYTNKAVNILVAANQTKALASTYNELGLAYTDAGKSNDAISAFEKSAECYNKLGDKKNELFITNNIGAALVNANQNKKAIDVFSKALTLAEALGDKKEIAASLNRLGVAYQKYGNNKEAQKNLNKALEIATSIGNSTLIASINDNIDILNSNIAEKENHQTTYEAEANQQQQEYVSNLKMENLKSMEEISSLSVENQAKEYRLVALQNEYMNQVLMKEKVQDSLKIAESENNLNKAELGRKQEQIAYQRNILILVGSIVALLVVMFLWIFRLYISKKKTLKIVEAQRNEIQKQKDIIQEGIEYASHIQQAIIPSTEIIRETLPGFFTFLKPRDIVSGDFYWHYREGSKTFLAAVDCTGHGVAGGLMSMIGNSLLNKIIGENKVYEPDKILTMLNNNVVETLAQSGDYFDSSMDISVCVIDDSIGEIHLSLAGHHCIVTVNGEVKDFDGSESAIGGLFPKMNIAYECHKLKKEKGLNLFMFSDGFPDQDGTDGKKLGSKAFIEFLKGMSKEEPSVRKEKLEEYLKQWMGPRKQRDDILVMGFRVE